MPQNKLFQKPTDNRSKLPFRRYVCSQFAISGQVQNQQRYLTQVKKKHDDLQIVLNYFKRTLILIFITAVSSVSTFRNFFSPLWGYRKNPGPLDASKLYTLHDVLFRAQNAIKFLIFNARSIKIEQDISNLLLQLDSKTVFIITESWISDEQSWNVTLSDEHNFMHKNWSHQTRADTGGVVGIWVPKN